MFVIVDGPLPEDPVFPALLEATVGGKSPDQLLSELPPDSYYVQQVVREDFSSRKKQSEEKFSETAAFACCEVKDLGFCDIPPFYAEVWARIRGLGHSLCEPEDALVLRRKLTQPVGDRIVLAMDGVVLSRVHHVYYLAQYYESAPCLGVMLIRSCYKIHLDTKIVFRLKRP